MHQRLNIETIQASPVLPWEERIQVSVEKGLQENAVAQRLENSKAVLVATSASVWKGVVGAGGAIQDTTKLDMPWNVDLIASYTVTLGSRKKFNAYVAELVAIATAVQNLVGILQNRIVIILSSNLSALQAIKNPKHQSGQYIL